MIRFLKRAIASERGQALPIVLALLMLGGLTIVPTLNYAATTLNHTRVVDKGINGIYAAEAGIENTLWCLSESTSPPAQLSDNVNRMQVDIQTDDKGVFTVYFGELVQAGSHNQHLGVSGDIVWDGGAEAWKYTITVTWQGETTVIHITEVGARLPPGYQYKPDSAASFPDNLSAAEPAEHQDSAGAYMYKWEFPEPYPDVSKNDPIETQSFYITGDGELEGDYSWVVANRTDIGEVGEMTGELYVITATASKDSETTATIVADIIMIDSVPTIISWRVVN